METRLPALKELKNPATLAYALLTGAGVVVTIVTGTSFLIFLVVALAAIAAGLAYALLKVKQAPNISEAERASVALNAIVSTVPEGRFLTDFLSTTIFNGRLPVDPRLLDTTHRIRSYRKDFRFEGADVHTHEEYDGVNVSCDSSSGMRFVSFGGSSVDTSEITQTMWQETSSGRIMLRPQWTEPGERLKVFFTHFSSPVSPNGEFRVCYEEFWPRAMLPGFDAVFYTQTLYFSQGVLELSSKISFDKGVDYIAAYWCDLVNGICKPHSQQPNLIDALHNDGPTYEWNCVAPSKNYLYFVAFRRQ